MKLTYSIISVNSTSLFDLLNLAVLRTVLPLHHECVNPGAPILLPDQPQLLLIHLVPVPLTEVVRFLL